MLAAVHVGLAAPLFSYQAMVLSRAEAEIISISPSPSMSSAKTKNAPSALVAITFLVQVGFASPLFSYQAMVSSANEADRISISPSPSMSAAKTDLGASVFVAISVVVKDIGTLIGTFPLFSTVIK